jgi:hypothetical protein
MGGSVRYSSLRGSRWDKMAAVQKAHVLPAV